MNRSRARTSSPRRLSDRDQTRGSSRRQRDGTPPPVLFPDVPYSFSNPPPFSASPQGPTFSLGSRGSAYTYFSMFFDDDLLQHIVDQTNLYARLHPFGRVNYQWNDLTVDELRSFFGIIIATGLVCLPSFKDYWKVNSILSQPDIIKGMSRNRFENICGRLHFNDNSLAPAHGTPGYDRLYKIRPILDTICQKCKSLYNPGKQISVDEAMVKFKGRSSIKQYQPLKPIKRGFKVWCRADSQNGYVSNFVVYTGKADGPVRNLGHKVVMEVCRDNLNKGHEVYFDNFFSTVELAADLLKHGTTSIATTRPYRVGFPKETVNSAAVAGHSRGYSVSTFLDNKIHCFVWFDKKPVFFIDTVCGGIFVEQIPQDDSGSEPRMRQITVRRGLTDGTRINVCCPAAVKAYNSNMGGVDLADQIRRFYTSSHKSSRR